MINPSLLPKPQKWTPAKYQLRGVKWLLEHACAGLLFKPGLRKTSVTLAAICYLKKRGLIDKVLIIAPKRVCYTVWPGEIEKWKDFNHLTIGVLHGKNREKTLLDDSDIHCINPEGLQWLLKAQVTKSELTNRKSATVNVKNFKKLGYDLLVVDELSKFKHTDTGRFKMIKPILGLFGRRWGLTGSPAANGLMDLFGETYVLDQGNALGPYITRFKREYFDVVGPFEMVPKLDAEERIYEKLSDLMMHVPDTEIDLPAQVDNDILIELDPESRRVYDQLELQMLTAIDERIVKAVNAGSKVSKIRQVCSGGVYLDPEMVQELNLSLKSVKREWVNLHMLKVDALEDLVDEMQHRPLLVAYDFKHDLDRLRMRFSPSKKVVYLCDTADKDFKMTEQRWNAGMIELMFGHPQSIGHGLNLQDSEADVCWHTLTYDQDLYDQFIRRVRRSGSKRKRMMVHRLMMKNTVEDLVIAPTLAFKDANQQTFFSALLNLAKRRKK
jgi:SNF2 family DNA or RNA helicase